MIATEFRHWKDAEDLLLTVLWEDGRPVDAISEELGRTVSAVRNRAKALKIKRPQMWTEAQDAVMRAEFGKPSFSTRDIARRLGRSVGAVKQRAMRLGLRSSKWWTKDEKATVRTRYGNEDAIHIARDLGRTRGQIHRMAAKLGLHRWPRLPKRQIAHVKKLYGRGLPDTTIAKELGLTYWRVKHIRKTYVGRPPHPDPTSRQRSIANQRKTLGVKSAGELRAWAYRRYAVENGWPEDLRPREVQVLNVLAARGVPLSLVEIVEAIGMRTDKRNSVHGGPSLLTGNGPGGTYTASLARRGLVLELRNSGVSRRASGKGSSRKSSLYTLGPSALAILQERAKCAEHPTAWPSETARNGRTRRSG
jgi:hypothetical protein